MTMIGSKMVSVIRAHHTHSGLHCTIVFQPPVIIIITNGLIRCKVFLLAKVEIIFTSSRWIMGCFDNGYQRHSSISISKPTSES